MVRAVMSKGVRPADQGSTFAVICGIESFCSLIGPIIFNVIYEQTLSIYRQLTFWCMAALLIPFAMLTIFLARKNTVEIRLGVLVSDVAGSGVVDHEKFMSSDDEYDTHPM